MTHTGAKYETDFNNDLASLKLAAEQYNADAAQEATYLSAYQLQWQAIVGKEGKVSPWLFLVLIMSLLANQGSNQLNERLATQGDQIQCQTDLGKLNNDITNMVNDTQVTNGNTNTSLPSLPGTGDATKLARFAATGLSQIMNALNANLPKGVESHAWYGYLQTALGGNGSGAENLFSNFQTLRDQFYLGGDPNDPSLPTTAGGTPSFTFDLSAAGDYLATCFNSFSELHRLAAVPSSQGSSGSANEATTVESALMTPLNTNTSMLQSSNAESQQFVNQTMNIMKTIATAVFNFGQDIVTPEKTANQNMSK